MLRLIFAVTLLAAAATQSPRNPAGCAPVEHRAAAVRYARLINTAESMAFRNSRRYVPLSDLAMTVPADAFTAQLSTDTRSYLLSIKDRLDPCQGAIFSDQEGLIYTAAPLQ